MTLRSRLTLWYAAVLAGVLVAFGVVVYVLLSYSLVSQIDDTLNNTAAEIIQAAFRSDVQEITLPPLATSLTANVYIQAWDTQGKLVGQNVAGLDRPFDPTTLKAEARTYTNVVVRASHLRVLTYPLVAEPEHKTVGYLELASSLDTVDRAQKALVLVLISGGVLAVGLAALVGWTTAGAALRPLDKVTETALQITRTDDLARRIPLEGSPRGEVGRLIMAFNESLERLENLFEAQRRFLADVSHELRTPLTIIRGNIDLVRRMGQVDDVSLDAVTAEVERMTRMVRDLLVLAQAESGKLPLAKDEIEVDTLLLEVFHQAKVLAQDRVEVRLGQEDQARVRGDRDRLKQVMLNLVSNAVDYTPAGGTVTLGLACVGEWARLTVSDSGPGIAQEDLPHIFERFYRIDRSRKRTGLGGVGLGLSIAYWITRSHGGRIEVASELGRGTTFSVWLPRIGKDAGEERLRGAESAEGAKPGKA